MSFKMREIHDLESEEFEKWKRNAKEGVHPKSGRLPEERILQKKEGQAEMNKCIFVGRTTRDVELRYTQSANPLAVGRTSIAVESGYGDKKKTRFFNISAFGEKAETMGQFVKKGTKIILE